jgi:hypothetical protein
MRKLSLCLLLLFPLLLSTPAWAQEHEITTTLNSGALSWFTAGRSDNDGRYKVQTIDLYLGHRLDLGSGLQLGTLAAFFREKISAEGGITASDEGTSQQLRLMIGPVFNFASGSASASPADSAYNDAFFAELLAGINFGKFDKLDVDKDLVWRASLGKRFALADNVSYSPNLSYRRSLGDGRFSQEFRLNYLVLSIFF